jgi:hypothetical protein
MRQSSLQAGPREPLRVYYPERAWLNGRRLVGKPSETHIAGGPRGPSRGRPTRPRGAGGRSAGADAQHALSVSRDRASGGTLRPPLRRPRHSCLSAPGVAFCFVRSPPTTQWAYPPGLDGRGAAPAASPRIFCRRPASLHCSPSADCRRRHGRRWDRAAPPLRDSAYHHSPQIETPDDGTAGIALSPGVGAPHVHGALPHRPAYPNWALHGWPLVPPTSADRPAGS